MIIDVDKVIVEGRHRAVDHTKVKQLAKSIAEIGLISPIIVGRNKLIAGAHRLEAYKLLGFAQIPCTQMGNTNIKDSLTLIEIDENLFRNELTKAEQDSHLLIRNKIMVNKVLPAKLKDRIENSVKGNELSEKAKADLLEKSRDLSEVGTNLSIGQQEVYRSAFAEANKEVNKELAEFAGVIRPNHIQQKIKRAEAIEKVGIKVSELKDLKEPQLNRVAKAAMEGGEDAAKEELLQQVNKPNGVGADSHDKIAETARNMQTLSSGVAALKREIKKDTEWSALKKEYAAGIIEQYEEFLNA